MQAFTFEEITGSAQLSYLLADDIEYITKHPDQKWGRAVNLVRKFLQYDELAMLPVFDKLIESGLNLGCVWLCNIAPGSTRIIPNRDIKNQKEIHKAGIFIPLTNANASYVWYSPQYIKHDNIGSLLELSATHGGKIIEDNFLFKNSIPALIQNQNYWAAITNKSQNQNFVFLHITLEDNPEYNQIKDALTFIARE